MISSDEFCGALISSCVLTVTINKVRTLLTAFKGVHLGLSASKHDTHLV
jgi:hypothetical protein